ncbi:Aspartyl protease AED1 [Bienertia sinuspersici]
MATIVLIPTIKWFSFLSLILLLFSTNCNWFATAEDVAIEADNDKVEHHFHTIQVSSLLPTIDEESCNPSTKGNKGGNSLEVRHRHAACSSLKSESDKRSRPSHAEILEQDEERVDSIRERVKPNWRS